MKDDTISRAAALDALDRLEYTPGEWATSGLTMCKDAIKALPSATDTNVGGNLIDRQAAISEIMEDIKDRSLHDDPATPEDYAEGYDEGIRNAAAIVLQMPSAQPDHIGEVTEMVGDVISRQAAIDAVDESLTRVFVEHRDIAEKMINKIPSAQPGWITIGAPMNSGQHYLVTLRQKFEGEETYRVRIMRLHEGHWLYPHHFPEWINDEMKQEVVAWMPLPKPWEGDANG